MRSVFHLLLAGIALVAAGCFSPETPDCAFRCDDSAGNEGRCPSGYTCGAEGYCRREGFVGECPFSRPDLSVVVPPMDMAVASDMPAASDGAADQGAPPDLALSCSDTVQGGDETDVDCGGTDCPRCAAGKKCTTGSDCASGGCAAVDGGSVCTAPDMAGADMSGADLADPVDLATRG